MKNILKKSGWIDILISIAFALIGIFMIVKTDLAIKIISYVLGGIFIVIGIVKVISYFVSKGKYDFYNYDLVYGLLACILGVVTIIYSSTIGTIFRIMIGIWIIYSSFIRISLSVKLKALELNIWIYSLILAFIMFFLRIICNI